MLSRPLSSSQPVPAATHPAPPQGPGHPAAPPAPKGALNLTYMRRASYQVASPAALGRYAGLGGWAGSGNRPRPASADELGASASGLAVVVEAVPTQGGRAGHRLRIINGSADTVLFGAQDSQLSLNLQARNRRGQWQDIEYVPSSWCGNSYHTVFLAPRQYWQLTVPAYAGSFPTTLRARLLRQDPQDPAKTLAVYSNEFAGRVNPGQFSRKEGHVPQDIMDPYNE